jgi:predicted PurR-regulated permease PerM
LPHAPYEWLRWIPVLVFVLLVLVIFLIGIRVILIPLLVSLALAYLLAPMVVWFERRGWSCSMAVLLTMTVASLVLVLALLFVVPNLWEQLTTSFEQAKGLLTEQRARQFLSKLDQISPRFSKAAQNAFDTSRRQLPQMSLGWIQNGLSQLANITSSLLDLLLIPFFVYYLLVDYRMMMAHLGRLVPPRHRATAGLLAGQISGILSTYVRSQLLIGFVMGGLYSVGFALLSVPLAITLGMLSGLLNFIPYLGTMIGFTFSFAFLALDGAGFARLGGIFVVFAIVQSVEGYYLTPKLLGDKLNMHPLWVIVGLVIGGSLFGLLGIILAVPVIAIAKVLLGFLEDIYQDSQFYRRTGTELLTESGAPIDLPSSLAASDQLIVVPATPPSTPRLVITTSEIESRRRETSTAND